MKSQTDSFSCGVFALQNAFVCLGLSVSEKSIRSHTATSPEHGTQDHGIKNAAERLKIGWKELSIGKEGEAWKALTDALKSGSPVILSTKGGKHWTVATGLLGNDPKTSKINVFDSSDDLNVLKESGSFAFSRRQLFKEWTKQSGKFYAIALFKI